MAHDDVPRQGLEVQRTLLDARVQLTACEDARVEITLGAVAQVFVLAEDLLEHLVDVFEFIVCGVFVPIDFVFHLCLGGGEGDAALDVHEDGAKRG